MVKLRGHHSICLHFFTGEGYCMEFIGNLVDVIKIAEGKGVEICVGADDVCGKCPYLENEVCVYEGEIREMDDKALDLLKLKPGMKIPWEETRARLPEIFNEWFGTYCIGCAWLEVCKRDLFFERLQSNSR